MKRRTEKKRLTRWRREDRRLYVRCCGRHDRWSLGELWDGPLSPEAAEALRRGIESAKNEPTVPWGELKARLKLLTERE